jgi:hypothetical protein
MSPPETSTEKLFNDIASFIDQSRSLLQQGALAELAGLDEQVRILCDAVLQLSQDERVRYADKLQELLGGLKSLGDEMVASRDKLAQVQADCCEFVDLVTREERPEQGGRAPCFTER